MEANLQRRARRAGQLGLQDARTVRDANKTEEIPVQVTYRLLSEAEIAQAAAKAAAEARAEGRSRGLEKARPA